MDNKHLNQLPFIILATLARSLAHKLRTPLSVVTNDLSTFKMLLENSAEDVDRSMRRCNEISDILRSLTNIGKAELNFQKINLKEFSDQNKLGIKNISLTDFISLDSTRFNFAIQQLDTIFPDAEKVFQVNNDQLELNYTYLLKHAPKSSNYLCLSEFFQAGLGSDIIMPSLIDAILIAHQATYKFEILQQKQLLLTININLTL